MSEGDGQRKNVPMLIAAVVILALAGLSLWWFNRTPYVEPPAGAWFYDVNTGERFVVALSEIPPVEAPSQRPDSRGEPAGVKVYVFSCGDCRDVSSQYEGYLETYPQEARLAIMGIRGRGRPEAQAGPAMGVQALQTRQIAKPEASPRWVAADSPEGAAIVQEAHQRCGPDKAPTECFARQSS